MKRWEHFDYEARDGVATLTFFHSVRGWYVNVHHGPDFSAPANGPSISCGDLPAA